MAYRKYVGGLRDKKIFRHTALKSKAINLSPKISRGGIRL